MDAFRPARFTFPDAKSLALQFGAAVEQAREALQYMKSGLVFRNSTYQVTVNRIQTPMGEMLHLSIKRLDKQPIHDWRELQEIKNQLAGPECEACELFPAESRLVDTANQYHLWVLPNPEERFPFGFTERKVSGESVGGSVQRPFPADFKENHGLHD